MDKTNKLIISLGACLALLGTSLPDESKAKAFSHSRDAIVQVQCSVGMGTAFHIGDGKYISVAHVTDMEGCKIDDQPITVISSDTEADISLVQGPARQTKIKYSCKASFRKDQHYLFIGYPAYRLKVEVPNEATGEYHDYDGLATFVGTVLHGMSGGPALDRNGVAVGTINKLYPARSRQLKGSIICKD